MIAPDSPANLRLLTMREAAARIGISSRTLRDRCKAGGGPPATRLGDRGRALFREDLLCRWIADHTRQEGAPSPPRKERP